jgi:hypothetical protein
MTKNDSQPTVPLSDAAHELGVSWHQAWRLLLKRRLVGRRVGNRWMVTPASIKKVARERRLLRASTGP